MKKNYEQPLMKMAKPLASLKIMSVSGDSETKEVGFDTLQGSETDEEW